MLGNRLLIPKSMRREVLQHLHSSHQGQTRTLRPARQVVFWPGMTNDVRNVVRTCDACSRYLPSQQPEPILSEGTPSRPFESIAADLFQLAGFDFLTITDRFSGWLSAGRCGHNATTSHVICLFKQWIMDYGAPSRLSTDGGPQFRSQAFADFCREWGIDQTISSPYYPQSNGASETAVRAAKHLVGKTCQGNLDCDAFREGMLELRNTPRGTGSSPAQLVFGHMMRGKIPTAPAALQSDSPRVLKEKKALVHSQAITADYFNQRARRLPALKCGMSVRVQNHRTKRWDQTAKVTATTKHGRSYKLGSADGTLFWRNRRFLRPYSGS